MNDLTHRIASISHVVFDAATSSTGGNSKHNFLCGTMPRASRYYAEQAHIKGLDLKVVDRCTRCEPEDVDTTLGTFEVLVPRASGRVDVAWAWLEPEASGA